MQAGRQGKEGWKKIGKDRGSKERGRRKGSKGRRDKVRGGEIGGAGCFSVCKSNFCSKKRIWVDEKETCYT